MNNHRITVATSKFAALGLLTGGLLAGIATQPATAAGTGFYFGVQYAQSTFELDGVPDLEPSLLVLRLGNMVSENFGIEGRLGGGISKDDVDFDLLGFDTNLELEVENFAGIYAVGRAPLSDSASIYGLLGYSSFSVDLTLDADFITLSGSDDESGLSFGIGADFGPSSGKFRFTVEYMSYLDEDEVSASAVSLGIQF